MGTSLDSFRQSEKFLKGRSGEQVIADRLQREGWYVIPSYDYSGEDGEKAPRLQGLTRGLVIPDLDIAKNGKRLWAEVKTKASATYYRRLQRLEHGIPKRHFNEYLEVQQITGCEVWLFVFEEDTREVVRGRLNDLARVARHYDGDRMSWGGMVFFPRDKFTLWATLARDTRAEVGQREAARS